MMVLGFIVQCSVCPQKAVIDIQPPERLWMCPRCRDAHAGFGDIDIAQAEPVETGHDIGLTHAAEMFAAELFPQHQRARCIHQAVRYGVCADCGDDDYPIGGVTA